MTMMNWLDYAVVAGYMLAMIFIGVFVSRYNKNDSDYFKGGNKIPWMMSSLSFFIGAFSAYMFVAASSKAYETGFASLLLFTSATYGSVLAAIFLAQRYRRTRITSPMEFVEMRYGNSTKAVFSFIQVLAFLFSLGSWLYVLCIFVSSAMGLTGTYSILGLSLSGLQLCMLVTGVIIVFYTSAGGLWAVVVTDTVQFCIVLVVSIIVIPLCLIYVGKGAGLVQGFSNFINNPPTPDYFKLIKPSQTISFTLSFAVINTITTLGNLGLMQRSCCVPDERAARKAITLASVLLFIMPFVWVGPVFIMRSVLPDMQGLWPGLKNPYDGTYVTIARMLLPNGMIGFTVAAIFAATMSSISTVYNIISAIITRDIYKQYIAPDASPEKLMRVGRFVTVGFGIMSIVMGFLLSNLAGAFGTTLRIASHFGIVFAFPMFAGIIIRRIPWWTALVSIPTCLAATLFVDFLIPVLAGTADSGVLHYINTYRFQFTILFSVLSNIVVFAVASLFYNESDPKNQKANHLFKLLKTPVSEDAGHKLVIPNLKMYRIVGWTLAVFGVCMIMIKLCGLTNDPQNINVVAGLMFLSIFAAIQWVTSPRYSPIKLIREQQKVAQPAAIAPDQVSEECAAASIDDQES